MSVSNVSNTITNALKDGKVTAKEAMQIHLQYAKLPLSQQNQLLDKVADYLATYNGGNTKAFEAFRGLYAKMKTWKQNPPPRPKPAQDWNGITKGGNSGQLGALKDKIEMLVNQGKHGDVKKLFDALIGINDQKIDTSGLIGKSPFGMANKLTPAQAKELATWLKDKINNPKLDPGMKKGFQKALDSLKSEITAGKAELKEKAKADKAEQERQNVAKVYDTFTKEMKDGGTRLTNAEKNKLQSMLNKLSPSELELLRQRLKNTNVSGGTKWSRGRFHDGIAWMLGQIDKRL